MARFPPPHWRPHWVFNKQLQPVALCFLTRLHTHTHLSQPASLWAALAMHPFPGGDFRAGEALRGAQGGGRCPPPFLNQGAGVIEELRLGSPRGLQWLHSTSGCTAQVATVPCSLLCPNPHLLTGSPVLLGDAVTHPSTHRDSGWHQCTEPTIHPSSLAVTKGAGVRQALISLPQGA